MASVAASFSVPVTAEPYRISDPFIQSQAIIIADIAEDCLGVMRSRGLSPQKIFEYSVQSMTDFDVLYDLFNDEVHYDLGKYQLHNLGLEKVFAAFLSREIAFQQDSVSHEGSSMPVLSSFQKDREALKASIFKTRGLFFQTFIEVHKKPSLDHLKVFLSKKEQEIDWYTGDINKLPDLSRIGRELEQVENLYELIEVAARTCKMECFQEDLESTIEDLDHHILIGNYIRDLIFFKFEFMKYNSEIDPFYKKRLDIYKKYIRAVLPMLQVIKDLKISIKEDMGPYCIGDVIEAFDEADKKIRGKIISSLRQELLLQLECIYRHMEHVCRTLLEQQAPLDAQESLNAQFPSFFEIFHSYNESGGGSPHDAPNRAIEAIKQMWTLIFGLELRIDAAGLSSCLIVFHEEESGFSGPTRELRAFLAEKGFVYADMLRELSSHLVVLDKLSRGNIKKAWKLRAQAIEDFKDNIKCYQRLFVLQKEAPTELLLEKINRDLELHQKMVDWLKDQKEEHIPDIWPRLIFYKKECIVRLGALQEMFLSQIHLIFCRYVELFKEQPLDVDLLAYMRNSMDKIDQGPLSVINKPLHDQIRVVFQMLHKMITSYQMLEGAPGSIAISREFLQEETAMGDSLERSLGVLPEIFHTPFTYIRGRHKEITDRIGQRFSKE